MVEIMRYLVIYTKKNCGDEWVNEFETLEEAVKYGDGQMRAMCDADIKNCTGLYVLESENPDEEAPNHYDGNSVKTWI